MATQQILLATDTLTVGRFICPRGDARWTRENWIGPHPNVVFPARSVVIEQSGVGRLVANPNHAVLYDAGRTYRRELVSPDGDVATFVALEDTVARDLLGAGPGGQARSFPMPEVWLDASMLLRLRLMVRALEQRRADPLAAETTMLETVETLVERAGRVAHDGARSPGRRRSTERAHRDLVEDAKAVLSVRFAERLRLADVASAVGASPYHLARMFREHTGQSIHGYREQIRLRTALDRLTSPDMPASLAVLAAELGFASHSHLDARFRHAFGSTPADVRAAGREMRTILQGRVPIPA